MNTYLAYVTLDDGTVRDETVWAESDAEARQEVEYLYRDETVFGISISQYEEAAE
jgi:hypothetical protein